MILSTHLFKNPNTIKTEDISQLFAITCSTIQAILDLDSTYDLKSYGTSYIWLGFLLALSVILRLQKTPLSKKLHHQDGSKLFLEGLSNFGMWSISHDDKTSKIADRFCKLWQSNKIFKRPDGSPSAALRIRTRLAMSIILDTFVRQNQVLETIC
jgi:hypothetical protein